MTPTGYPCQSNFVIYQPINEIVLNERKDFHLELAFFNPLSKLVAALPLTTFCPS
jgi:hypothetical protein